MSVDADISASEDLFGKTVSDLQENVVIGNSAVTGTLKYVSDYTGFSSDTEMQSGNYIAIHAADNNADTITVELVGGTSGPRTLDSDGIIVLRVANKNTQTIQVISYLNGSVKESKSYSLTGLMLESESEG